MKNFEHCLLIIAYYQASRFDWYWGYALGYQTITRHNVECNFTNEKTADRLKF